MKLFKQNWMRTLLCTATIAGSLAVTGCQIDVGGQTLPSPYYLEDDVQYFAPGPEFKLTNEAAAQKKFNAEQRLQALGAAP